MSAPAHWIRPAGVLIDLGTLLANRDGGSALSLNGCHEFDAAVPVPMVVPVDECIDPLTGLPFGGKGLAGVIRPVLRCAEQRFEWRQFKQLLHNQPLSLRLEYRRLMSSGYVNLCYSCVVFRLLKVHKSPYLLSAEHDGRLTLVLILFF